MPNRTQRRTPLASAAVAAFALAVASVAWTDASAVRLNVKMGSEVPMTLQERAFTSPIWYTPN